MNSNRMPVLFLGHGSPMNAIEENSFSKTWQELGKILPKPKSILMLSAHWYTSGLFIQDEPQPKMVYDMYGFPEELYQVQYQPVCAQDLSKKVQQILGNKVSINNSWGFDHGMWSVLCHMFPDADIPVCQLSIDKSADASMHFQIGKALHSLREEGVLIMGSGNIVHNLSMINWQMDRGFLWADEFDEYVKNHVLAQDFEAVVHYESAGPSASNAFFTPDHFFPFLTVLGCVNKTDTIRLLNEECIYGSLSMTSYLFS